MSFLGAFERLGGVVYSQLQTGERLKTEVRLAIARRDDRLVPFMSLAIDTPQLPGFLEALMPIRKYLPVVAIIDNQVVTCLRILPEGCEVRGQPIRMQS